MSEYAGCGARRVGAGLPRRRRRVPVTWPGSHWPQKSAEDLGVAPASAEPPDVLMALRSATAGQSFLEWVRLGLMVDLFEQMQDAERVGVDDLARFDVHTRCAAAIATTHNLTQNSAERLLGIAVVVDTRLPLVGLCLRDGLIGARELTVIVERTELITDLDQQHDVDSELERLLRRPGSWSIPRLRDAIDAIVARTDPDAVRRRQKKAREDRAFHLDPRPDGMAEVSATMVAEDAITVSACVDDLAGRACARDGRAIAARRSDALFCLTTGAPWSCRCEAAVTGVGVCDAPAPPQPRSGSTATVVMHVLCDLDAVVGDGENPGHLDGYGTITADQVRELARRADTDAMRVLIRPLGGCDGPLPATGADLYRPSTALDTLVRLRDLYCTVSGCTRRAWMGDLDHVNEFDHDHPDLGGVTSPEGLGVKCRFHHNWKTFTDVLDDQYIGPNGRVLRSLVVAGVQVPGPAFTGEDLAPGLADVEFEVPDRCAPPPGSGDPPTRHRSRLAAKHARRRAEREANRRDRAAREQVVREQDARSGCPPPF